MRNKDTSLRMQRDEALFEAYTRALRERNFASQSEAINFVRRGPAPRFFIDGNFCTIVIGRMRRGKPTGLKGEQRKRKFYDLYRLFLQEKAKPGNESLPVREICSRIVEMPAPEFYLNYRAASGIIARQRELKIKELEKWAR